MQCKRCGACCIKLGYKLPLVKTDLKRWIDQNRLNILKHLKICLNNDKWIRGDELKTEQLEQINYAKCQIWSSPRGKKLRKCPFLRKERNKSTYKCLINDTKPDRCRKWEPWKYGLFGLQGIQNLKNDFGYQCWEQKRHISTPFETKLDKKNPIAILSK
jgi:Fe-S-cluster containining protein